MEAMDGPVNFGPRDHFWGCLKEGFHEPVFNMPYNPPYYNRLFEMYGFKDYYKQFTYHLPMRVGHIDQSIMDTGARLIDNKKYRFEFYNKRNAPQTVDNFLTVFNAAWANFPGVSKMRKQQGDALFKALKFIIDPKLFIFCFYDDQPIAFFLMIPDLNQIIKSFNGKLHWFNKLRLFYKLKVTKGVTRALGMIFGVVPEFQGKGIPAGMIKFFEHEVRKGTHYTDLEMNWIGEFNPKMIKLVEQLDATVWKTHITYRYLFDQQKEFKRAKRI
jgi:GNAT superfamily N-acetyltransferase